ncbi:lipopolysaccharide biosynthesis protein [Granulicella mallensis]|uniref:O-antigen/teichoic acid export membrane protein n=1 Tax=Granulicella mallensis TaxID=940614 RepID=A0A7W8E7Y7_9BACT|nr:oligosaccharide flippase family protein [Granulicella mallensis]MBB5061894.1 O-antigen/teichoic acid export membrane protein [Granulicella mallensis]
MSQSPSLLRDVRHYLSGKVFLILLGFISFPIMTRMLSVADFGIVSLTLRIALLLTVLSKCGLQYSAARFYDHQVATPSHAASQKFYTTLVSAPALITFVVVAIYYLLIASIRHRIADPLFYNCLLLVPAVVVPRTLQSVLLSFLRNEGRSLLHSVLEVCTKALTICGFFALIFGNLRSAFYVLAITAIAEGTIVLWQLGTLVWRRMIHFSALDVGFVRSAVLFGAPLIAYELSSIVLDSGDRLLIRHYLGDISLGYYSAAYNVSSYLQDTLVTPLNLAIVPIYMRLWNPKDSSPIRRFLSQGLSWFAVAACAMTGLAILCSKDAIVIVASAKFIEARHLLPILIPSLMIYGAHIFLTVGLILEKRTAAMAGLVALAAVVNVLLNIILIPRIGLAGGAWSTLLSYALLIGLLAVINQRILPLQLNFRLMLQAALATVVAAVPASLIHTGFPIVSLALRSSLFLLCFTLALAVMSLPFREAARAILMRKSMPLALPLGTGGNA